jgi:hypothetical protein
MRSVFDGGDGVIRGGTLDKSRDKLNLFLDDRRLDLGVWSGVSDADDVLIVLATGVVTCESGIGRGRQFIETNGLKRFK